MLIELLKAIVNFLRGALNFWYSIGVNSGKLFSIFEQFDTPIEFKLYTINPVRIFINFTQFVFELILLVLVVSVQIGYVGAQTVPLLSALSILSLERRLILMVNNTWNIDSFYAFLLFAGDHWFWIVFEAANTLINISIHGSLQSFRGVLQLNQKRLFYISFGITDILCELQVEPIYFVN